MPDIQTYDYDTRDKFTVRRKVLDHKAFERTYDVGPRHKKTIPYRIRQYYTRCLTLKYLRQTILQFFPFLKILSDYKVKEDLLGDIVSGITIATVHIPQGMAYGLLANLTPIYGLYVAFFSILVYFVFGTSKHLSIGPFAVTSLMVGAAVEKHYSSVLNNFNGPSTLNSTGTMTELDAKLVVATTVTLCVGLIQLGMGCLRLGFLTIFLSHPLTRGFTTGSGFHVFTAQFKNIWGVKIPRYSGPLNLIKIYIAVFKGFDTIIWASVIIFFISAVILIITKEVINEKVKKYIKVPIPIELILVIFGIIAASYGDFNKKYKLAIVGDIPLGIPGPKLTPDISFMSSVIGDSIAISIVSLSSAISLGKIFAKKHNYEIDYNQEILSHGIGNIVTSFFSCFVFSAIMSISLVQEGSGGKTQLAGLISAVVLMVVLLRLGTVFKHLPNAVLAAIIMVSLKGIFMQFGDLKKLWRVSKHDLAQWLAVFLVTVIVDVDYGLFVGIGFALLTVLQRSQRPYTSVLGHIANTDLYRDITISKQLKEFEKIKIIRFEASLYFTNKDYFLEKVYHKTEIEPRKYVVKLKKMEKKLEKKINKKKKNPNLIKVNAMKERIEKMKNLPLHTIILDCGLMAFADTVGISTLDQVMKEYDSVNVKVLLGNCNAQIMDVLESSAGDFFKKEYLDRIYVTVHDAILATLEYRSKMEEDLVANSIVLTEVRDDDNDNDNNNMMFLLDQVYSHYIYVRDSDEDEDETDTDNLDGNNKRMRNRKSFDYFDGSRRKKFSVDNTQYMKRPSDAGGELKFSSFEEKNKKTEDLFIHNATISEETTDTLKVNRPTSYDNELMISLDYNTYDSVHGDTETESNYENFKIDQHDIHNEANDKIVPSNDNDIPLVEIIPSTKTNMDSTNDQPPSNSKFDDNAIYSNVIKPTGSIKKAENLKTEDDNDVSEAIEIIESISKEDSNIIN